MEHFTVLFLIHSGQTIFPHVVKMYQQTVTKYKMYYFVLAYITSLYVNVSFGHKKGQRCCCADK